MSTDKLHLDHQHLVFLLGQMMRIRVFERRCAELYQREKIRGFLHLYDGEEAIAVGVMAALGPDDTVVATYREHGHAIARGIPMTVLMAELYGKVEGCCRGRGGSTHFFDRTRRYIGGNAIVGGGLPLAVGTALADQMQDRALASVCFFGEGAVDEGEFHESLNLAALWHLPVLFVCENNYYSMGTALAHAESVTDIHAKARAYGISSEAIDGNDVIAVEVAARRALSTIRAGAGPQFLECRTYRFRAHSMYDAELYRTKEEVNEWKQRDPIATFEQTLRAARLLDDNDWNNLNALIATEVEDAVTFAEASPWEPAEDLTKDVCSRTVDDQRSASA